MLITGGSEGIGLGLAARFLRAGSSVLVTGRSADKLARAAAAHPGLLTHVSDAAEPAQREALTRFVGDTWGELQVLVNNTGIQRRVGLAADTAPWTERQREIDVLLSGPVHLSHLLLPLLLASARPTLLVNVTSGGAYIPQPFAPVYSACKAAVHSYTVTLRQALRGTACRVAELIPPAVQTGLAGPGQPHGAPLEAFCDAVFAQLLDDSVTEIGYGPTVGLQPQLSGRPVAELFEASAARSAVPGYAERRG